MHPYDAAEPQAASDLQRRSQPHNPAHYPYPEFVGLNLRKLHVPGFHQVLVHSPALRASFFLPASDRPLVQAKGGDYGLDRRTIRQQGEHHEDQLLGLMEAIERGALRLSEGAATSLATVALLFLAMDHDMLLALAPVGPTGLVVAELLLRVHATLLLLTSYTSKDVAESAFRSSHPSSTVAWGATSSHNMGNYGSEDRTRDYFMVK